MTLVPLALALMLAVPHDFELTLERGPCYGSCPIYRVTIDANGAVVFHGERFTSAVGEHKRAMLIDDVQQLVRAARELDFFTLGNYTHDSRTCREYWTDQPTAAITIRMYGHTKTVDHNLGCRGFDQEQALIAFERLIDELAGTEPLARYDRRIEERRRFVNEFVDGCTHGVDCERAAKRLARATLMLFELRDEDLVSRLRIDRDGSVRLMTGRLRFVHEVRSTLPRRELDEVREQIETAKRMPIAQRSEPRRQVVLALPLGDDLPSVRADVGTLPFDSLADDRTWTDDAKSIRVEAVPTDRFGRVEPWPAEDLVPVAQLTSRGFTAAQWRAIAARLGYNEEEMFKGRQLLDGKPFGSAKPVFLRLIAAF
jgi:hypothetical protein